MSAKPAPKIPADTRDAEINRLHRVIHHLQTAHQICSLSAMTMRLNAVEQQQAIDGLTTMVASRNESIESLEAMLVSTWKAAIGAAVKTATYADTLASTDEPSAVSVAIKLLADEDIDSITDMVLAAAQGA